LPGGVKPHVVCSEDSHVSVERMEVLSGVLRRRQWSTELKERTVSETLEPGVTIQSLRMKLERASSGGGQAAGCRGGTPFGRG
jgi:hypothetical protein